MNYFTRILSLLALAFLAACGGGGGNSGSPLVGGSQGSSASDLVIVLSSASVPNTAGSSVTATVTALDANRNAVSGVPVSFRVDNGGVVAPAGTVTDAEGKITAVVGIGADSTPRSINVSAGSGSITRTAPLTVTSSAISGAGTLELALSSTSISSATPATVTATLKDSSGRAIAGQVVTFSVARQIAAPNIGTALTDSAGRAVVVLAPINSTGAGADEIRATANVNGTQLAATRGFQVQATNVTIDSFSSAVGALSAYGQTTLQLSLSGVSVGSPVQISINSSCATLDKAVVSPSTFTATTPIVALQYRDAGCGAIQVSDQLQATIVGSANSRTLSLPIAAPSVSSLAFIGASPETIFLRGSGFAEASIVTFEVRDAAGNPLPNRNVVTRLLTLTGGVTMEGGTADVLRTSDASGRISVRVNSGSLPTPVRVSATLQNTNISTVSSNLSVAVGLPSQLNFSLSQGTLNIEGYNIDGTPNTYQIIAADRSGNPVPAGTSVNFVTEGGQVEAIKQTALVNGIARTTANFVSAEPRPLDGRVTITAYALGEESFIDLNGNNTKDPGEPFQDLGNIFKDRLFDGMFDASNDEFIPLAINNSSSCADSGDALLRLNPSVPAVPATCDGLWSGAGQVYVRRAIETVLSTSAARPLWANTSRLDSSCAKIDLQFGPQPSNVSRYTLVGNDTWYDGAASGSLSLIVGDNNPVRLNPMPAGTTITATTPTTGLTVTVGGGSPVPSTTERTFTSIGYNFADGLVRAGVIFITFRSPGGVATTFSVNVNRDLALPSACPTP